MATPNFMSTIYNVKYRSGFSSLFLLEETLFTLTVGLSFPLFCPFFETFNERIDQMIANGMIAYWYKNRINPKGVKRVVEKVGQQVLTLAHLAIGFQICLNIRAFLKRCSLRYGTWISSMEIFEFTYKYLRWENSCRDYHSRLKSTTNKLSKCVKDNKKTFWTHSRISFESRQLVEGIGTVSITFTSMAKWFGAFKITMRHVRLDFCLKNFV